MPTYGLSPEIFKDKSDDSIRKDLAKRDFFYLLANVIKLSHLFEKNAYAKSKNFFFTFIRN